MCLLWRNVYLGFLCIFFFILSCISCLYILEINTLLVALFANILSQFVKCLFILLIVSFNIQRLLSLINNTSDLFLLLFSLPYETDAKKNVAVLCIKVCFACVFGRSFIISSLKFRSLIHFKFIFIYGAMF